MKDIKLLVTDVDGVLTDGRLFFDANGECSKFFHVHDGHGLKELIRHGLHVAVISARSDRSTEHRLNQLKIPHIFLGAKDKLVTLKILCQDLNINLHQTAYMGDDLADLACMQEAGFAIAPANAVKEIKQAADFITTLEGGHGAVREICDLILKWHKNHVDA